MLCLACWTDTQFIMGSNLGRVKIFNIVLCSHHVVVLRCAKNCFTSIVYLTKIYSSTLQCKTLIIVASFGPTLQPSSSAMLVLPNVGNQKVRVKCGNRWDKDQTQISSKLIQRFSIWMMWADKTDKNGQPYLSSFPVRNANERVMIRWISRYIKMIIFFCIVAMQ